MYGNLLLYKAHQLLYTNINASALLQHTEHIAIAEGFTLAVLHYTVEST